ncbi:MAG: ATP-binding protein [Patescibacteria group bacterium]|nr:ATP-binding protein [Patescibacteria group bacterium]MDD4610983.1 ATP-binding protein [Patescibacteria group bacterium]
MKIFLKVFLSLISIAFLCVLVGGFSYNYYVKKIIEERITAQLESINSLKEDRLDDLIDRETSALENVSRGKDLVNNFNSLLEISKSGKQSQTDYYKEISSYLDDSLAGRKSYFEFFIISPKGEVVVSTDKVQEGKDKNYDEYFIKGKFGTFFQSNIFDTSINQPTFTISTPLRSPDGSLSGVLAGRINFNKIDSILSERSGLGATGETYLVSKTNILLTKIYNIEDKPFEKFIDSDAANECINGKSGFGIYRDYRNVLVLGNYHWISRFGVCLLTEIDQAEALSSLKSFQNFILIISSVLLVIIFVLGAFFIGRLLIKPLEKLTYGAKMIGGGNLDYRIEIKTKDEYGQLGRAFNEMTSALKNIYKEADKKIIEQTKEITESQATLELQQKAVINVLEDVEDEKNKVSHERDKINAVLHSIGDGVFVVDEEYRVTMYNDAAALISGFSPKEILGKKYDKVLKFILEKDEKIANDFIERAIRTGEIQTMANHTMLVKKNGEKVMVADSAAPIKDKKNKVIGCVVVFRDVTKEREVDKAKTEFVSLSSHQLRTPLTSINWYTEMLLSGDAGKLNEEQRKYLEEVDAGTKRMVDLVNALLNVSRIELGTFAITPTVVDFIKEAEIAVKEQEPEIKLKKIKFNTKYPDKMAPYLADKSLLHIIFQNLISNATKYTPEGGAIKFEIAIKDSNILVKVADTGYGIPDKAKSQIFAKLFRADNVKEKDTTGTGLGLYIIKSIVEKINGKIWFDSTEGKGTTFYVELPLSGFKAVSGAKKIE